MRCPCCGAIGVQRLTLLESMQAQLGKVVSLGACISTALVGQAELIGEPWRHYVTISAIVLTAIVAWNIKQHPVKESVSV